MSEERVAIMAVDPGGTTGFATGVFDLAGTVERTIAMGWETISVGEVEGAPLQQSAILVERLEEFEDDALTQFGVEHPVLVIEGFALRTAHAELSPVMIAAGLMARIHEREIRLGSMRVDVQMPGEAKSYATNDRLKRWDVYDLGRGSDHKRDALRHMALRIAKELA